MAKLRENSTILKSTGEEIIATKEEVDKKLLTKADKTEIPTKLSQLNKDINFDERYYTETEIDTKLAAKSDKTHDHNTQYEPKNSNIQKHISDTSNPHQTTKTDVGLGNVQNYGIATQTEAQTGTSNTKYMTPLRTKQAIDNASVYHVGKTPPTNNNLLWINTNL